MIKLSEILTSDEILVLNIFDKKALLKIKNEIDSFNEKTKKFEDEAEKIAEKTSEKINKILEKTFN